MKNKIKFFRKSTLVLLGLVAASFIVSCVGSDTFRDDLPDSNSKADTVFPEAAFDYTASQDDFTIINFTDLSSEASNYSWDFGGGAASTERDPSHTFAGEGTFPVTLTASDGNGITSTITLDVVVINELISAFKCPSFECDPRTPWAGDQRGGTSTYTTSQGPTPPDGSNGAKISSSSQYLDQTILVVADAEYDITFWHVSTPGSTNGGKLLIEDADNGDDFISEDIPASPDSANYVEVTYRVKTGATTENMRFNIEFGGSECRYDLISIERIK